MEMKADGDGGGGGEGDYTCVWSEELGRLVPSGEGFLYGSREGTYSCTRVMVNSIENVDTVTDKAEYRTRSVLAREVGWQTCPGALFHWSSLRIRIQVMTTLIGKQHEVQVSAELGRQSANSYIACTQRDEP